MKVQTLDGTEYNWSPSSRNRHNKRTSRGHAKVREIIIETYPASLLLEEVPIKIMRRKTLYLDFFLPTLSLAIEVMGRQHFEFVQHFHKTRLRFMEQKKNDRLKKEWLMLNGFNLVCTLEDGTEL